MALIAVGAAAAATVASTAMKASAGGPGDPMTLPMYGEAGKRERRLAKEVTGMEQLEGDLMANALGQYSNLAPELYAAALGMVPQYEDNTAAFGPLRQQQIELKNQQAATQAEINRRKSLSKKDRKAERKAAGKSWTKTSQLQKERKRFETDLADINVQVRDMEAMPKRITGFSPAPPDMIPADSPLSSKNPYNQIRALTNESLINALRGDEPLDQTMVRSWNEREDQLRRRLRTNLGPDYETSTAGIQALAELDRQRSESFQQYNTNLILNYDSMAQGQAQLMEQQLAGILERGTYLPKTQMEMAAGLNAPIGAMQNTLGYYLEGRKQSSPFQPAPSPDPAAEALGQAGAGLGSMGLGAMGGGGTPITTLGGAPMGAPEVASQESSPWGVRRLASSAWGGIKSAGSGISDFLLKY